jgi:hypothetical protein
MTRVLFVSVFLLLLSLLTLPVVSVADGEPSANGSFQISMENGQSRQINFTARLASDGRTSGEITVKDQPRTSDPKAQTNSTGVDAPPPFYAKAVCDCLMISGIEAALSGTVTESSWEGYVGRRVLLVVQDGDSITPPLRDKLTFGFYKISKKDWLVTDSERPEEGTAATWVATDSERYDDAGTLSQQSEGVTCESFPISSHSFIGSKQGRGKIEVTR